MLPTLNSERDMIGKLRRYYASNHLYERRFGYDEDEEGYRREWHRHVLPLRNVIPRVVDFFAIKMLPSDIKVLTANAELKAAVEKILAWSNFNDKKKLLLSDLALVGENFLKVNVLPDKCFFEYVRPEDVVLIDEDYRGNLQSIRIEYEVMTDTGQLETYTEYWNKEMFGIWQGQRVGNTKIEDMGDPLTWGATSEFGIDFVPFAHMKFKDLNRLDFRGTGAVEQSLDVIDEANRQASRLAQQAFRDKPIYTIAADSVDANGFTLSPIKQIKKTHVVSANPTASEQNVSWQDDIWELPAMSKLTSLLVGINWAELKGIVDSTMQELSEQLPALKYYDVRESNVSPQTLALMLDASLSQAKESSRSFINGITRACQIGLTMGIASGLFPASLGSYAAGDFEFTIDAGEAFALGVQERVDLLNAFITAGVALPEAMKLSGYTREEIDAVTTGAQVAMQNKQAVLASTFNLVNTKA
jgi:hypothetical protein